MIKIDKLSEKKLLIVLEAIFNTKIEKQKRFKTETRLFIVDYYLEINNDKFIFEFDGPTHYTRTKTQIRDLELSNYCDDNNIHLVRFPYFLQINECNCDIFFKLDVIEKYNIYEILNNKIKIEYKSGFHDTQIVYPSDFNYYGWILFNEQYINMANTDNFTTMKEIYHSLFDKFDPPIVLGLDCSIEQSKIEFYENYPT